MGAFFCADGRALCLDRGDDHGVRVHRMKSYTCGLDARKRTHARTQVRGFAVRDLSVMGP